MASRFVSAGAGPAVSVVWQIAAGDAHRDYSDLFLDFGVACVGPGAPGPYFENKDAYNVKGKWAYRRFMRPFCEQVEEGHLLAVRGATEEHHYPTIAAVGKVTSGYRFDELGRLSDVEGWNLAHHHIVEWHVGATPVVVQGISARSSTLHRVVQAADEIRELYDRWPARRSRPLPPAALEITAADRIISILIEDGLPAGQAETIVNTIWKVRRVAGWYQDHKGDVSEHEIRSFVIIPLLLALGWAEQRIKIEWRHRDIALFDRPYTAHAQLQILVESKRIDGDLGVRAAAQVARYAHGYPTCRQLLITDGIRYKLSEQSEDGWAPVAYINLLRLLDRHPYLEGVAGAPVLLRRLLPDRLPFVNGQ